MSGAHGNAQLRLGPVLRAPRPILDGRERFRAPLCLAPLCLARVGRVRRRPTQLGRRRASLVPPSTCDVRPRRYHSRYALLAQIPPGGNSPVRRLCLARLDRMCRRSVTIGPAPRFRCPRTHARLRWAGELSARRRALCLWDHAPARFPRFLRGGERAGTTSPLSRVTTRPHSRLSCTARASGRLERRASSNAAGRHSPLDHRTPNNDGGARTGPRDVSWRGTYETAPPVRSIPSLSVRASPRLQECGHYVV
jgi:hypothetical protein